MNRSIYFAVLLILWLSSTGFCTDAVNFAGHWVIDLRPESQRSADCGGAYFTLLQNWGRVCGDHGFATTGCSRLNEGFPGSVRGIVVGSTAVLVVTSGRNGAIVLGKATRKGDTLHWSTLEHIKSGEPEGDSPLILEKGILKLDKSQSASQELVNACYTR